jgi:hypothetical protein
VQGRIVVTKSAWLHPAHRNWPLRVGINFSWPHPAKAGRYCSFPGRPSLPAAEGRCGWGRNLFADDLGGAGRTSTGGTGTSSRNPCRIKAVGLIAVAVTAAASAITACGSSAPISTPTPFGSGTSSATSAAAAQSFTSLTRAQVKEICTDLLAWSTAALAEDPPRFTPRLESDEQEAAGTKLGRDMSMLDSALQTDNSQALEPGPPGQPSDAQVLAQDCQSYGILIPLWSS